MGIVCTCRTLEDALGARRICFDVSEFFGSFVGDVAACAQPRASLERRSGPEPDVARIRRAPGRKRGTYGQITVNGVVFLRGRSVRVDAHVVEYTKVLKEIFSREVGAS